MKAILVFDVQMTEDVKHICDSCPVWDEKMCGCKYDFMTGHKGCPLKPMPTKKKPIFDPDHCDIEEEIKIVHEIVGYNRCIDEILGETKNETVKSAG